MPKLKVEDLAKIKEKTRKMTILREGAGKAKVTVHMGTCGIASGAREIMSALLDEMTTRHSVGHGCSPSRVCDANCCPLYRQPYEGER